MTCHSSSPPGEAYQNPWKALLVRLAHFPITCFGEVLRWSRSAKERNRGMEEGRKERRERTTCHPGKAHPQTLKLTVGRHGWGLLPHMSTVLSCFLNLLDPLPSGERMLSGDLPSPPSFSPARPPRLQGELPPSPELCFLLKWKPQEGARAQEDLV